MNFPDFVPDETWLRSRFAGARSIAPVTGGDGHLWRSDREIRPAAVLVPVVKRDPGLTVLFTRRTAHLHDHAGQISFPGGRTEPGDAGAAETAMREAAEEIGLPAPQVEVLGELPKYVTVTGYRVTPVVGLVTPPLELKLDDFEVAEVFEVPLAFLLDPANHQQNYVQFEDRERYYYAIPYRQFYIWGATAGMLMNLHAFLAGESAAGNP
ncbi:MAG TPA: CoA pyrophosphatase [Burkholderiales bacterium]|nr:CoA pyrophosphatase [Burkholderiales bacterium]